MSCNAALENSIFEMRRVLNDAAFAPRQSCFIVLLSSSELPLASLWHIWPSVHLGISCTLHADLRESSSC